VLAGYSESLEAGLQRLSEATRTQLGYVVEEAAVGEIEYE
jgi:hypothetical protein